MSLSAVKTKSPLIVPSSRPAVHSPIADVQPCSTVSTCDVSNPCACCSLSDANARTAASPNKVTPTASIVTESFRMLLLLHDDAAAARRLQRLSPLDANLRELGDRDLVAVDTDDPL